MWKNNKTWIIIVGIAILLLVIFLIWKKSNDRKLAAQAERDRLQQQYLGTSPTATTAASGATTALNSLGGVIDSLANLFGKNPGQADVAAMQRKFENECESQFNDVLKINQCVDSKMAAAGLL